MSGSDKHFGVAAALALAAIPTGSATAADPNNLRAAPQAPIAAPNPFFVSLEGGAAFSDFSKQALFLTDGKLGISPARDLGAYGAISIGRNIEGTAYDWRVSASATQFMPNEASAGEFSYYGARVKNTSGFQAADIDFGRKFNSGALEARVFGGLRALHASSSSSAELSSYGYYGYRAGADNRFLGFGPRIGADVRFGHDLGIVASVAAAALYGRHDSTESQGFFVGPFSIGVSESGSRYDWVTDVSASLGVSYRPSKMTEFVAGYRGEKLFNIGSAQQQKNLTSHGPFVRANVKF